METINIVEIALYVPFALVLFSIGIRYLIKGYKNDFLNSVISIIASGVAVGVSLLFSRLISSAIGKYLIHLIPAYIKDFLDQGGMFTTVIVEMFFQVISSFLLFNLLFMINLILFKELGKMIPLGKLRVLNTGKVPTRLLGMVIRGVDAVLVTVMLLVSLYGSIATLASPVTTLMGLTKITMIPSQESSVSAEPMNIAQEGLIVYSDITSDDSSIDSDLYEDGSLLSGDEFSEDFISEDYIYTNPYEDTVESLRYTVNSVIEGLEVAVEHPILTPYKYGPGAWVYSELSSLYLNGRTLDVTDAAVSIEGLIQKLDVFFKAMQSGDVDGSVDALQDLIDYARTNVIQQQWSYALVMAFVGEVDSMVELYAEELSGEEEIKEMYDQLRPLLDMTFEEYTENAEGILDFAAYIIELYGNYGENFKYMEEVLEDEELYARLGKLLNQSEQMVGVKRIILQEYAQKMFDVLHTPKVTDYDNFYKGRENLPNTGSEFINKYFGDGFVAEEDQIREAGIFVQLLECSDPIDLAECFARHPLFGADAIIESMGNYLYIYGYTDYMTTQLLSAENAEDIFEELNDMLRECEDADFNDYFEFYWNSQEYLTDDLGFEFYPEDYNDYYDDSYDEYYDDYDEYYDDYYDDSYVNNYYQDDVYDDGFYDAGYYPPDYEDSYIDDSYYYPEYNYPSFNGSGDYDSINQGGSEKPGSDDDFDKASGLLPSPEINQHQ